MENRNASPPQQNPIFNKKYKMVSSLGEGNTSKVYLAEVLNQPKAFVAVKILRDEFLAKDKDARQTVVNEVLILLKLKHPNIVQIYEYGDQGVIEKPSGRRIENLVYIVLEFVSGGLLFDLCQTVGGLGEDAARFFFKQLLVSVDYMNQN